MAEWRMGDWHLAGLVGIFAESLFACMYGCTNTPGGICETMEKTPYLPVPKGDKHRRLSSKRRGCSDCQSEKRVPENTTYGPGRPCP